MFTVMRNVDGFTVWTGGLPSQDLARPGINDGPDWCDVLLASQGDTLHSLFN